MWLSELVLFFKKNKKSIFSAEVFEEEDSSKFVLEIKDLSVWRVDDGSQLLSNVNLKIPEFCIVSIIGPSGSGKSSLLKSINGVNFEGKKCTWKGEIKYKGLNVLNSNIPFDYLRTHIGTVLQKPVVFPMSISENVLFALKARGMKDSSSLGTLLEKTLRDVYLWDEVKNRLDSRPEDALSIGQQQRLCIARAVALRPKILLMDEPTSALDSKSSGKIEELVRAIVKNKISTIVFVSHSLSQVKRISDYVVFIKNGSIVEQGRTVDIFNNPKMAATKEFISDFK